MSAVPGELVVEGITVRFGGLTAVDGVSLRGPAGKITGLIGPNGAGKTTTFNACTGVVRPQAGRVQLGERVLDGLSTSRRAQCGLGRTFQRIALWPSMTVAENVALGYEARLAGRRLRSFLWSAARERREGSAVTDGALEICGLQRLAGRPAAQLSTGQQRLVELARALAGGFTYLLLDEPSSGLDEVETGQMAAVLRAVVAAEGIGVLLIEHDMSLVRAVCDSVSVLDFGRLIHQGPTDEVLGSDLVQAAYLGQTAVR